MASLLKLNWSASRLGLGGVMDSLSLCILHALWGWRYRMLCISPRNLCNAGIISKVLKRSQQSMVNLSLAGELAIGQRAMRVLPVFNKLSFQ